MTFQQARNIEAINRAHLAYESAIKRVLADRGEDRRSALSILADVTANLQKLILEPPSTKKPVTS